MGQPYDVFISYAWEDKDWVRTFADALEELGAELPGGPLRVFRDEKELESGDRHWDEIEQAIESCHVCIPVMSQTYADVRYTQRGCAREWRQAKEEAAKRAKQSGKGKYLLPVGYEDVDLPSSMTSYFFAAMQTQRSQLSDQKLKNYFATVRRHVLEARPVPVRVFATTNMKGGVGKTTLAVAIAECLASPRKRGQKIIKPGHNVLMVDGDPQSSASTLLLGPEESHRVGMDTSRNVHEVVRKALFGDADARALFESNVLTEGVGSIKDANNRLWLVPGSPKMLDLDGNRFRYVPGDMTVQDLQAHVRAGAQKLGRGLRKFAEENDIEVVIVDTGPHMSWMTTMFLDLADAFIMPMTPDAMALSTTRMLIDRNASSYYRPGKKRIQAIVVNRYVGARHKGQKPIVAAAQGLAREHGAQFAQIDDHIDLANLGRALQQTKTSFYAKYGPAANKRKAAEAIQDLADGLLRRELA